MADTSHGTVGLAFDKKKRSLPDALNIFPALIFILQVSINGITALEEADLVLRKSKHIAIMGDNRAGKSTLVRKIIGVEQGTSGASCLTVRRCISPVPLTPATQALKLRSRPSL